MGDIIFFSLSGVKGGTVDGTLETASVFLGDLSGHMPALALARTSANVVTTVCFDDLLWEVCMGLVSCFFVRSAERMERGFC